jgi:AcrR family transcriptional regulator
MGTRDDILEAAVSLVLTEGGAGATVRAVAAKAGVGATTLRHYFPTQYDLHCAVADRLVPLALDDLHIADPRRAPSDRLFDCLVQFLPHAQENVPALRSWLELYRTSMAPEGDRSPAVPRGEPQGGNGIRAVVVHARRQSSARIERWLTQLATEGHLPGAKVSTVAAQALALVDGLNLSLLLDADTVDLERARDTLRDFVRSAVTAPTGPRP